MSERRLTPAEHEQLSELLHELADLAELERERILDERAVPAEVRRELAALIEGEEAGTLAGDAIGELGGRLIAQAGTKIVELGPGSVVGPYTIVEQIGEGGMGKVYLANQSGPVARQVALKVCKAGFDGESVLRRFDRERQALAAMSHDAIARVFDAGSTQTGRPYFAMEYIDGQEIHRFCDVNRLSICERLQLFREVCEGVQHAHQRGVIHRDLKPGNILVTQQGDRAVPKLIDFGLVRATQRDSTEQSMLTEQGMIFGTPEFMSPEQACGNPEQVDTRSDVYSLGVVLYQLLSGQLPFSSAELRDAGPLGIQRILQVDEPRKPSTRASGAESASTQHAVSCRTTARGLYRSLRGELDWVVMKALEKDPERRYQSAHALASDVELYLERKPVLAGPPSAIYRVRAFVRRYTTQVIAGAVVAISLIAGIIVSTTQARIAGERAVALAKSRDEFRQLASRTLLDRALRDFASLQPAWPDKVAAMRAWLSENRRSIFDVRASLRATVTRLEDRSLPFSPEQLERDRETHPKYASFRASRGTLELYQRMRQGFLSKAHVELPSFPAKLADKTAPQLDAIARPLVVLTSGRADWGKEALALTIAKHAESIAGPSELARACDTLAYAYMNNGMAEEAIAAGKRAIAAASDKTRALYVTNLAGIQKFITQMSGSHGVAKLGRMRDELDELQREVEQRRTWEFDDPADAYLHETLKKVLVDVDSFAATEYRIVEERLAWASGIGEATVDGESVRSRWRDARHAIRKADGEVASRLYARHPIDLKPQVGLVPIGMNPRTKLWEFYHVRSAAQRAADDPRVPPAAERLLLPKHDPKTGQISVREDTGIVFVLVPGGTFSMGEQSVDPEAPNYDPEASRSRPVHRVELGPFFLARHEVTQAQWDRLSLIRGKFAYPVGYQHPYMEAPVTGVHPAETIRHGECLSVAQIHGLALPTDAQWEYACRAGTLTPWWTGRERESLLEVGNVVNLGDMTVKRAGVVWAKAGLWPEHDDGWLIHAPVDRLRPNPWGMHSMNGNVREWCLDLMGGYELPTREGDGLRLVSDPRRRVRINRGSSFVSQWKRSRASHRAWSTGEVRRQDLGVRLARAVH